MTQDEGCAECDKKQSDGWALYCVDCLSGVYKKEWVGLTVEEVAEAGKLNIEGERMLPYSFARAIEAKLKEKNDSQKRHNG